MLLKGHQSLLATPDGQVYINSTGNPGMATGGTGDVLTGLLAGFIGQGCDAVTAAQLAVYLHGLAGDLAAEKHGQAALVAGDLLDCLAEAMDDLVEQDA